MEDVQGSNFRQFGRYLDFDLIVSSSQKSTSSASKFAHENLTKSTSEFMKSDVGRLSWALNWYLNERSSTVGYLERGKLCNRSSMFVEINMRCT